FRHLNDIIEAAKSAFTTAVPLVASSLLIALLMGLSLRQGVRRSIALFRSATLWTAALLPLSLLYRYAHAWPLFRVNTDCSSDHILVCQGPTPVFTGAQLVPVAWAQLACIGLVAIANPFPAPLDHKVPK